jgi:5-methylthioadenosine/S-adenosylhomocysteine deaminase
VGVVHCPGSNLKLASGIAPLPKLLERGAVVGLGTDGAASNNNLDLLEEARLAALIHKAAARDPKVIDAHQALELATRGSAAALGLLDRVGTLEPGKRADLAIFDLSDAHLVPNHHTVSDLVYSARAGDVRHTIVDGAIVMRDREFVSLDEEKILAEARTRAHRLVNG